MEITLNKVPFTLAAVSEAERSAILSDPAIRPALVREVWAWDGTDGQAKAPIGADGATPLPIGVLVRVSKAGGHERADGPTEKMAKRLLEAVGAKDMKHLMQALSQVTGLPKQKVPLAEFEALKAKGPFSVLMSTDFAVLAMGNAGRNLHAFLAMPVLTVFAARNAEGPVEGSPRPGFVLAPANQPSVAMRRLAVVERLGALQASLAGAKPTELPPGDIRRDLAARLGAEWKVVGTQGRTAPPPAPVVPKAANA